MTEEERRRVEAVTAALTPLEVGDVVRLKKGAGTRANFGEPWATLSDGLRARVIDEGMFSPDTGKAEAVTIRFIDPLRTRDVPAKESLSYKWWVYRKDVYKVYD